MLQEASTPQDGEARALISVLERIERRLDHLEISVSRLDELAARAPAALAAFTDTADDVAARVDLDERLQGAVRLVDRLTRPDTLEKLEGLLAIARDLPQVVTTAGDTFDSLVDRAAAAGFDLDERLQILIGAAERLTSPAALRSLHALMARVDQLEVLLTSGVLEPGPVRVVGKAGRGIAAIAEHPPQPIGTLGMLRALGDPDVQRTLAFGLQFARSFGAALAEPHTPELSERGSR